MKVIIAGSRTITDPMHVYKATLACGWIDEITEIVCGDSEQRVMAAKRREPGAVLNVDINGALWALTVGLPVAYFPADWDNLDAPGAIVRYRFKSGHRYNAKAGPDRNQQMARYADALILVWTGRSSGSADMLLLAARCNLRIYEHIVREPSQ